METTTTTETITLAHLMSSMLNDACPSRLPDEDGWAVFYIETHCVGYSITARPPRNGRVLWEIKEYTVEDC